MIQEIINLQIEREKFERVRRIQMKNIKQEIKNALKGKYFVLYILTFIITYVIAFNIFINSNNSYEDNFILTKNETEMRANTDKFNSVYKWEEPITYSINKSFPCSSEEEEYIDRAFNILANETDGALDFKKSDSGKIIFSCKEGQNYSLNVFTNILERTLGDATPYYITSEKKIVKGEINLYGFWKNRKQANAYYKLEGQINDVRLDYCPVNQRCIRYYEEFPDTEIHEILHLFGYDDGGLNDTGIMSGYDNVEHYKIDDWIIKDLKKIYG